MNVLGIAEEWRQVVGFEGRYDVSSLGNVRGWRAAPGVQLDSPRPLVGALDRYGYRKVLLRAGPVRKNAHVHSLVAQAFIGPRPPGHEVNHRDGVKTHNAVANLEYVTAFENHQHASRTGLKASGRRNGASTLDHARLLQALTRYADGLVDLPAAARIGGCDPSSLTAIIAGRARRDSFPAELLTRCREVSGRRQRHTP